MDGPTPTGTLPRPRGRTSESAVFALVLGVTAVLCFGPFAGVPAAILGGVSYASIRRSRGRLGGSGMALTGALLGGFGSVAWVVGILLLGRAGAFAPTKATPATASPISPPATTPTPTPPPRPSAGKSTDDGGQLTTSNEIIETRAGTAVVVDVPPTTRSFLTEIAAQEKKGRTNREKTVLFVVQEDCRPCVSVAAVMMDPKMQAALDHVRLVRVDITEAEQELNALGIAVGAGAKVPGFYLLGPGGNVTDGINGGEWDDDTAENAAPVLGAFVRGALLKRKERFVAPPPIARPAPTIL